MPSSSKSVSHSEDEGDFRKGPWTREEDNLLFHYIAQHGEGQWNLLSKRAGLRRTGKSCRLRWLNYLKPDVKRGNLTLLEQLLILDLHSKWGNRWSKIAQHLPGRTDNEIKNYWRTRVQKQARQFKIDANSKTFQDMIRCFWMPRLLQKMEESTFPPDMFSGNPTISQPNINHASSTLQPPLINEVPCQGPVNMSVAAQALKHHKQRSDSEHYTGSCVSSAESLMSISHGSQFSECSPSPFHVFSNNSTDYNTFTKDCCHADGNRNELQTNPVNFSSPPYVENPTRDHHMAESLWLDYDLEETMWDINGLAQFKLQEISQN